MISGYVFKRASLTSYNRRFLRMGLYIYIYYIYTYILVGNVLLLLLLLWSVLYRALPRPLFGVNSDEFQPSHSGSAWPRSTLDQDCFVLALRARCYFENFIFTRFRQFFLGELDETRMARSVL